ncbi:MAG: membrane protein insertion efficiency factor YidD [Treponema sp.]|nr:membrane protein insertion efficiency factor YidD [Treponema sp.]
MIHLYQKTAPQSLRASCRFEPSCSNYMIMAVEKYGSIKGCFLGLKRFFRCRYPNGGIDYP